MAAFRLNRRSVLTGLAATAVLPRVASADEIFDLRWNDLLPTDQPTLRNAFRDVIDHTGAPLSSLQPEASGYRTDWVGKTVRIPGFIVPLDYAGSAVTTFILVPYAGACIHVPPPPANQLVLVTTDTPFESGGIFEAVHVTGQLGLTSVTTELAEVGYSMTADDIRLYRA